jgi:dienelactone hydrolase
VLAACGGGGSASARRVAPTTTTVAPTTTTTSPAVLAPGSRAVGVRTDVYVDTTRPTPPNGGAPGSPTRSMPTTIWYPATGSATLLPTPNAPPDVAHGPYPLVVFAHGFAVTPQTYGALLARWASAGYVVVAPALPLLNGDAPGGASHADYGAPNIADLDFVVGEALRRAATPGDPLAGLIDPTRVAVAGHSDGEVLAYALGLEACCHDPRVKAVIAMAGNLANAGVLPAPTGVPILHILDDHDPYDPYPASIAFDRQHLPAPNDLLTLISASHLPPFSQPTDPHFDLVTRATVDFLDATLKGRPDGLTALQALVGSAPTLGVLEANPAGPPSS